MPNRREVESRAFEERVFEMVAEEMRQGIRREGLWLKAFSEADADETRAKSIYIRYRAQAMLDDAFVAEQAAAELEAARNQAQLDPEDLDALLIQSALDGDIEGVETALAQGANIDAQNKFGATALFLAVLHNRVELTRLLIDAGADRAVANGAGRTPLQVAQENGNETVQRILRASA